MTDREQKDFSDTQREGVALLRQDIQYMARDIAEIKSDVKESRLSADKNMATKDELATQASRIDKIYNYGGAILLAVSVAAVIAFIRLVGPHL